MKIKKLLEFTFLLEFTAALGLRPINLAEQTKTQSSVDHVRGKFSSPIIKFGSRNQNSALEKRNPANQY
jgi:hypothetical protein